MKITTATILGFVFGVAVGFVGMGSVNMASASQLPQQIHQYAWWIVVLSMLAPLADYLSGIRTTMTGVVTKHPFRQTAGFFTGLAFGLGLFLLLSPRLGLLQNLHF